MWTHSHWVCVSVRADTLAWHVLVLCGHCVRMRVRETCIQIGGGGGTRMDGRGDTRMDGGGDTRMDGGGGTRADGGGEKSVILAPIKLLTSDAGLWTRRARGWVACADVLHADMLSTEACRWVECGRAGCECKNKNKSAYKGVSIDTQRGSGIH